DAAVGAGRPVGAGGVLPDDQPDQQGVPPGPQVGGGGAAVRPGRFGQVIGGPLGGAADPAAPAGPLHQREHHGHPGDQLRRHGDGGADGGADHRPDVLAVQHVQPGERDGGHREQGAQQGGEQPDVGRVEGGADQHGLPVGVVG